jgi:hypothetical protein
VFRLAISQTFGDEFHDFYETAKKLVDKDVVDFGRKITEIPDNEEREFLLDVTTFFLQKRQKEVIKKGLF